jgi:hypothetical protein
MAQLMEHRRPDFLFELSSIGARSLEWPYEDCDSIWHHHGITRCAFGAWNALIEPEEIIIVFQFRFPTLLSAWLVLNDNGYSLEQLLNVLWQCVDDTLHHEVKSEMASTPRCPIR